MSSLRRTLTQLAAYRRRWAEFEAQHAGGAGARQGRQHAAPPWLVETQSFGTNPGQLRMLSHIPRNAHEPMPLVVVLHGCTQTASAFANAAGWRQLADEHGFALLCPEQTQANNAKRCFNWFLPADVARVGGECQSIASMIGHLVNSGRIDAARVFVTGLSAGGAMACAMLATYPELFAGGSIIAGLPYAAAHNVQSAFEAMFRPRTHSAETLGDRLRLASPHARTWPPVAIWHGTADQTVLPVNARELVKQWRNVHKLGGSGETEIDGRLARTLWMDPDGVPLVSQYIVQAMAHGAPICATGPEACGTAAPFVLDVGISAARITAGAWGLLDNRLAAQRSRSAKPKRQPNQSRRIPARHEPEREEPAQGDLGAFIETTIHRALTAAGLMKR